MHIRVKATQSEGCGLVREGYIPYAISFSYLAICSFSACYQFRSCSFFIIRSIFCSNLSLDSFDGGSPHTIGRINLPPATSAVETLLPVFHYVSKCHIKVVASLNGLIMRLLFLYVCKPSEYPMCMQANEEES